MNHVTHQGVGAILVYSDIGTISANVQTVKIKIMTVQEFRLVPLDSLGETSALIRHNSRTLTGQLFISARTFFGTGSWNFLS